VAVAAAIVGNALEWFDFTVYGLFSIYIAKAFFPAGDEFSSLLAALATYGVGFVLRPFGAIVLGQYADRHGRRAALTLIILLMVIGSGIIAFAPTYAVIGPAAPALIVVARLIQGFSVGGEMGGATSYLIEMAPAHRRGLYASWQYAGQAAATLTGSLFAFTLTHLMSAELIADWGWRLPFIFGLSIGPVGLYLRWQVPESPAFAQAGRRERAPLVTLLKTHRKTLLRAFALTIQLTATTYLVVIYMPTYAIRMLRFPAGDAFVASSIASLIYLVMNPLAGRLSDQVGRLKQLTAASLSLALAAYPAYLLLAKDPSLPVLLAVQGGLAALLAMLSGPSASLAAEIFPPAIRSTGLSIGYNLAVAIFGGFAPYFVARFDTADHMAPAFYLIACALPTLATLLWMRAARD
jgi:MHS family proline/betaine transporter-like MFS transporter